MDDGSSVFRCAADLVLFLLNGTYNYREAHAPYQSRASHACCYFQDADCVRQLLKISSEVS